MKPSGIQRREKLTTLPMKGSSTITSSTSATTKTSGARFSHTRHRHLGTASAATRPSPAASACRDRKWVGE
jgi:hypothetical protein